VSSRFDLVEVCSLAFLFDVLVINLYASFCVRAASLAPE